MIPTRRRFLQTAGGLSLALPFLPSLMGESRAGGTMPRAKRFVFMFTSNGQRPENWYPADPAQWNVRDQGAFVRDADLTQYAGAGGMSPIFGPEFDDLLPKLLLFRGLDFIARNGGGHNPQTPLSGWQVEQATTIDQVLANSAKVYPSTPAIRSLHAMVKQAYQAPTTTSVDVNLQGIPHQTSTAAIYQQLFADFVPPDDAEGQARLALRTDALDRIRGRYDQLAGHQRIGAEDRQRLEAHADLLSDLRDRLGVTAATCEKPDDPGDIDLGVDENLALATETQMLLIIAGLVCARTSVVTFMLCPGTDLRDFGFMGLPGGEHHGLSHDAVYNPASSAALAAANNWYAKQVAEFLHRMDELVEDPIEGTTYLDNSIVYWGNEDGCNGYDAHVHSAMPVLLAGGGAAGWQTGRYIDYRMVHADGTGEPVLYDGGGTPLPAPTDFRGRAYNSLLISILQGMGLQPADYESGSPGFGDYAGNLADQYDIGAGQQPLPFLAS